MMAGSPPTSCISEAWLHRPMMAAVQRSRLKVYCMTVSVNVVMTRLSEPPHGSLERLFFESSDVELRGAVKSRLRCMVRWLLARSYCRVSSVVEE